MPIKILPPQLANQIAAGEVVERPSSVVKELVENSLDAGATRIQIDIEHGGATLIRVRDNGLGIEKSELALALARHATSKITSIEDLETILSLGFRGEALASISSVSRLTLTSRTAEQSEAWQVYAQGREMETVIQPASHPVGTTVEVANLFFNTPARRKFLRTEKTEFSHIDEVIRRIALAKPQITFILTHNGKTIRQYKSAVENHQVLKRVAAICGEDFIQQALHIDWRHDHLHLSGWVGVPQFHRTQNDLSYCYVNGRMVRDKVINHAIRQAYADYLNTEQYPAFVLFIDLDPNEVDVNVHPTKHEVRFHQARLIHDFICQGISHALNSAQQGLFDEKIEYSDHEEHHSDKQRIEQGMVNTDENRIAEPAAAWTMKPNRPAAGKNLFAANAGLNESYREKYAHFQPHFEHTPVSKTAQMAYAELLNVRNSSESEVPPFEARKSSPVDIQAENRVTTNQVLHCLALIDQQALLLQQNQQFYLLSLKKLQRLKLELALTYQQDKQHLLIPIMFRLTEQLIEQWQQKKAFFQQIGFEFAENLSQQRITLNAVPRSLRQQNLQKVVMGLLEAKVSEFSAFFTALCGQVEQTPILIYADAVSLLTETEQLINQQKEITLSSLLMPINWQPFLEQLQ